MRFPQKTRPCQGDPRPSLITELRLTCKAALRVLLRLRLKAETLYSYSAFKVLVSPSSADRGLQAFEVPSIDSPLAFQLASEKNSLSSNINIIQRAVHLLFEFFVSFIGGAHSSVPVACARGMLRFPQHIQSKRWGLPRRLLVLEWGYAPSRLLSLRDKERGFPLAS